jgi:hypothetical protein
MNRLNFLNGVNTEVHPHIVFLKKENNKGRHDYEIRKQTQKQTRIITNQPSPLSRVLLEKLTVTQLVKKFPAFYGTRRFITVFTKADHCSLF